MDDANYDEYLMFLISEENGSASRENDPHYKDLPFMKRVRRLNLGKEVTEVDANGNSISFRYHLIEKPTKLEVLRASELKDVIKRLHESKEGGGHHGVNPTFKKLRQHYCKVTFRQVKMYVSKCETCNSRKSITGPAPPVITYNVKREHDDRDGDEDNEGESGDEGDLEDTTVPLPQTESLLPLPSIVIEDGDRGEQRMPPPPPPDAKPRPQRDVHEGIKRAPAGQYVRVDERMSKRVRHSLDTHSARPRFLAVFEGNRGIYFFNHFEEQSTELQGNHVMPVYAPVLFDTLVNLLAFDQVTLEEQGAFLVPTSVHNQTSEGGSDPPVQSIQGNIIRLWKWDERNGLKLSRSFAFGTEAAQSWHQLHRDLKGT